MELKRILNKKIILILFASILLNIFIFLYMAIGNHTLQEEQEVNKAYIMLVNSYDHVEFEQALNQLQEYSQNVKNEKVDGNLEAIQLIQVKITHLNEYSEIIHQIIQNAENLKTLSIFSHVDSYSYHNILKTAKDFDQVSSLSLSLDNDRAVEAVSSYTFIYYLAFADFIVLLYVMLLERENGMWNLIYSMQNGRYCMAWKRVGIISVITLFQMLLMYGSTLLTALCLYGGWSDLSKSVQTLNAFSKYPYICSKATYLMILFFVSWFVLWTLTIIVWLFFIIIRNRNLSIAILGFLFGIEVLLYQNISVQNTYNFLKYLNIINLFQINQVLSTYRNWGFGTVVWSVWLSLLCSCIVLVALGTALSVLCYGQKRPGKRAGLLARFTSRVSVLSQHILYRSTQLCKELTKLFVSGKALYLIVAMITVSIYFVASNRMNFTENELEMKQLYETKGGKDYQELQDMVEEKRNNQAQAEQSFQEALQQKQAGLIEIEEFNQYYAKYMVATEEWKSISSISEKISYLNHISTEYGINGYLMSDCGYEEILGEYSTKREIILILILVSIIVLTASANVTLEFSSGMASVVRGSVNGRAWAFRKKIYSSLMFALLLFVLIYGVDFLYMNHYYGFPFMSAPVMSLTFLEGYNIDISILGFIMLQLGTRLCLCMFTVGISMLISLLLGKRGNKSVTIAVLILMLLLTVSITGLSMGLSGKLQVLVTFVLFIGAISTCVITCIIWQRKYVEV